MENIFKIMEAFRDCGVSKEVALDIMHELTDNCHLYADNQPAIDDMLRDKLDINAYISLKQYLVI